jgi:hypothetical protein
LKFVADFVLCYSRACPSPACPQSRQDAPQVCHRKQQKRRRGIAAQRWRCQISAFLGFGALLHSTRLHDDIVAAADGDAMNKCNSNNMREININVRKHISITKNTCQKVQHSFKLSMSPAR